MTALALPDAVLPDAPGPIQTLIAVTQRLATVIMAENDHLRSRKRPADARPMIEEKGRLAAAYAREMEVMRKNGGVRAFGNANELRILKRETSLFQTALDDHRKLLERARAITEGIIKAVGDEVTRQNQSAMGYGKNAAPPRQRSAQPTSLTLNQVV
ncbi:hypothetical protein [Govanella unica]|uniref:Flagellar basal-body protein FlbY n=1 Tax=Govanella unica TaxID=2975056 RepID=A0A9X3TWZ0_9PROT|nr:hypothetical protein [Govania unica]MDA5193210.1 hypothetical protein [Govania unica]